VPRRRSEIAARTFDRVRVTVALVAEHRQGIGGGQVVQRSAVPVRRDVPPFRLRDLQKVAADARQADGLGRRRSLVRRGHLLQIKMINTEENRGRNQNSNKSTHTRIVALADASRKQSAAPSVLGNNGLLFPFAHQPLC
jgi:hypothetical protein